VFELDQYEKGLHHEPPAVVEHPYSWNNNVSRMSLLVWGEHCIECSAPSCYQTCDLYQSRPDTRCRRFRFGIYKNRYFPSLRGYGAEVSFKKWGVLAAMGNTAMEPRDRLIWEERLADLAARVMNAVGPLINRATGDSRWQHPAFGLSRRLSSWLHGRNSGRTKPDAFLLEVYNPATETVRMQLLMDYAPEARRLTAIQTRPQFRTTLALPPGYSRHEFESRLFRSFTETGLPFNISLTPEGDTSARLVFLSADFVSYGQKVSDKAEVPIKCIVWDLDHTLWDGILIEDEQVRLRADIKRLLESLDKRGILLSIASKNEHESAWRRLESLGVAEYFLSPQINWRPKSENIKTIASALRVGLDTFAFIDDNPFELTEVATAIPDITCINVQDIGDLLQRPRFQGSNTEDATNRRRYYQEAIVREEKHAEFGNDYLHFLAYCDIRVEVGGYRAEDFERVAELVQRTNQLNFSGQKYERNQLRETLNDSGLEKYVLSCSDKFGSYGLIGFALVRHSAKQIEIQDLMLSCRVQGKMIEQAFFSHLHSRHNPQGVGRLWVNFKQTKRNEPARQALEAARFKKLELEGSFVRECEPKDPMDGDVVHVKCLAGCNGNGTM
jgi:FkbH-like protein